MCNQHLQFNQFEKLSVCFFIVSLGEFGEFDWFGFLVRVNTQYDATILLDVCVW